MYSVYQQFKNIFAFFKYEIFFRYPYAREKHLNNNDSPYITLKNNDDVLLCFSMMFVFEVFVYFFLDIFYIF